MAVIKTVLRWSCKFEMFFNVFFGYFKLVPFNNNRRKKGEKEFFKKIISPFKKGNIFTCLGKYDLLDTGVMLRRYLGNCLLKEFSGQAGNEKLCKIYFKKLFFQNVLAFIDVFYRYHYIHHFIYLDCMWHHVCTICNSIVFI